MSPAALAAAAACSLVVAAGCVFDRSGIPPPTGTGFEGCFRGASAGGVTLRLQHEDGDQLWGVIAIGQGSDETVYALSGRALSDTVAELKGAAGALDQVTVDLLLQNNAVSVEVDDVPVATPLGPC